MAIALKSSVLYISVISNTKTYPSAFIYISALYLKPSKSREASYGMKKSTDQRRAPFQEGFYYKIECQTK